MRVLWVPGHLVPADVPHQLNGPHTEGLVPVAQPLVDWPHHVPHPRQLVDEAHVVWGGPPHN